MPQPDLLARLEKLSAKEKLDVIQFLAESLQTSLSRQTPSSPPPPPAPKRAPQQTPPGERVELASAPGQSFGRMSTESTMQLSVNDLIETEEDAAFVAALVSPQASDPPAPEDDAALAASFAAQAESAKETSADPVPSEGSDEDAAAEEAPGAPPSALDIRDPTADTLARQVDDAMVAALDRAFEEGLAEADSSGSKAAPTSTPEASEAADEPAASQGADAPAEAPAADASGDGVSAALAAQAVALASASAEANESTAAKAEADAAAAKPDEVTSDRAEADVAEADVAEADVAEASGSSDDSPVGGGAAAVAATVPLDEAPQEAFVNEDRVFEALLEELAEYEFGLMDALSTVRRHFWAPLQDGFKALDTSDIKRTIETMEFAPLRIAIGELVNASIIALVQTYHDHLGQHFEAQGLKPSDHKDLFVTKKNQSQLVLSLRTPFRDYIGRLEQLDQARDTLLEALEGVGADALEATSPVLSPTRKETLEQYEEALGIEGAWRTLLDAIRFAELPEEAEASLSVFSDNLASFLAQLSIVYREVLERVLELWGAYLMAPAKSVLPGL